MRKMTMKRIWIPATLFMATLCAVHAQTPLFNEKEALCVLVEGAAPSPAEKFAVKELAEHLRKISGKDFAVVKEGEVPAGKNGLYVGNTVFASKNGIDPAKLGREEWVVRSIGRNLVLSGGGTRGSAYAVYDFLERELGCRWFDEYNSTVPRHRNFTTGKLDIRRSPAFRLRQIYDVLDYAPRSILFKHRNKGSNGGGADFGFGGIQDLVGSPNGCHTFYFYSKDWPKDRKELWSLGQKGERQIAVTATGPGQLCMTNPETRARVIERMTQYIQSDRRKADLLKRPYPLVYDLSPNDNSQPCCCPECKKLEEKHQAKSGPLLDFVNFVAAEMEKTYPEIYIRTFAYVFSLQPPKGIAPRRNVIINIAILGNEFVIEGVNRDTMSPLSSPTNAQTKATLDKWGKIAPNLAMWDYWQLYTSNSLANNVHAIPQNLRYFKQINGIDFFTECGFGVRAFFGLKRYLGYKFLDDLSHDENKRIDDYMKGMYGKAAPFMRSYYNYLTECQVRFGQPLGNFSVEALEYMDDDFFVKIMSLFEKAQTAAAEEPPLIRSNLRREKLAVLDVLLQKWNPLGKKSSRKLPFDKNALIAEYEQIFKEVLAYYIPPEFPAHIREDALKKMRNSLDSFRQGPVEIPKELQGKKVRIVPLKTFQINNNKTGKRIQDPEANGGLALCVYGKDLVKKPNQKIEFGLYSQSVRKFYAHQIIPVAQIAGDEKYHLYKVGTLDFAQKPGRVVVFAWPSWCLGCPVDTQFTPEELKKNPVVDVYISFKLQGKDYVPGSTRENEFCVDGLFIVEK